MRVHRTVACIWRQAQCVPRGRAGSLPRPTTPAPSPTTHDSGHPAGEVAVDKLVGGGQKLAESPQAQPPDALGFSMEKPEASRLSFQSITAPCM